MESNSKDQELVKERLRELLKSEDPRVALEAGQFLWGAVREEDARAAAQAPSDGSGQ